MLLLQLILSALNKSMCFDLKDNLHDFILSSEEDIFVLQSTVDNTWSVYYLGV